MLVKQFHKLLRTVEFDLFGFLNLEILIFEVDASTEFYRNLKFEINQLVDNVENPDMWGLHVSGSRRKVSRAGNG